MSSNRNSFQFKFLIFAEVPRSKFTVYETVNCTFTNVCAAFYDWIIDELMKM